MNPTCAQCTAHMHERYMCTMHSAQRTCMHPTCAQCTAAEQGCTAHVRPALHRPHGMRPAQPLHRPHGIRPYDQCALGELCCARRSQSGAATSNMRSTISLWLQSQTLDMATQSSPSAPPSMMGEWAQPLCWAHQTKCGYADLGAAWAMAENDLLRGTLTRLEPVAQLQQSIT